MLINYLVIVCYLLSVGLSVNRYGYRFGNSPTYGSKFGYPFNSGQYFDHNRPMVNSADPLVDANNYWRHYRERYPPGKQ